MQYLVGFAALALAASPLSVSAQEARAPSPWLESELGLYGLELDAPGASIGATDRVLLATLDEPAQSGNKGRLDDFYAGPLPEQDFDERRLHGFYPEGASREPESKSRLSKQARIAIGVAVPVVVLTAIAAGVAVSAMNNMELFEVQR